jgi:hypothetical protein
MRMFIENDFDLEDEFGVVIFRIFSALSIFLTPVHSVLPLAVTGIMLLWTSFILGWLFVPSRIEQIHCQKAV